jgi:hypothetical protein
MAKDVFNFLKDSTEIFGGATQADFNSTFPDTAYMVIVRTNKDCLIQLGNGRIALATDQQLTDNLYRLGKIAKIYTKNGNVFVQYFAKNKEEYEWMGEGYFKVLSQNDDGPIEIEEYGLPARFNKPDSNYTYKRTVAEYWKEI